MRVRILENIGRGRRPGAELEVSVDEGQTLIDSGRAELIREKPVERAVTSAPETAAGIKHEPAPARRRKSA